MELATTDQAASKTFYSTLFGWSCQDIPLGPEAVYTMFALDGRRTGAAFTIRPEERAAGIPPHWQLYIAVKDVDAALARALELGGTAIHNAIDVGTFGRMAVIEDPAGAVFSMWQAGEHKGMGVTGEPGALCWADLQTSDREGAAKFYGGLFGWEFTPGRGQDPAGYLHIRNRDSYIGGLPPSRSLQPGAPPHWLGYIETTDCEPATVRAQKLGAKVLVATTHIEGSGQFSVIADPQGAVFALFASGQ